MLTLAGEGMDSRESPLEQMKLQWKVPCQMWKYIHNKKYIYYDFNSFFETPGLLKPLMQVGSVMAFTQLVLNRDYPAHYSHTICSLGKQRFKVNLNYRCYQAVQVVHTYILDYKFSLLMELNCHILATCYPYQQHRK